MRNILKLLSTNWINFTGIFFIVLLFSIIRSIYYQKFLLIEIICTVIPLFLAIIFYGSIFWGILFVGLLLIDTLLIRRAKKNLRLMLIIEWLIISSPFIYWFIIHIEWIWLISIITFFFTQLLRESKIRKILNHK